MDLKKQHLIERISSRFSEFKQHEKLDNEAVDKKWREIMENEYLKAQQWKIDSIRANFLKQLDRCDAVVERLYGWLVNGEKQYQFSMRAHKKNLEDFVDLTNRILDKEYEKWENQLNKVVDEFENDRIKTIKSFQEHVAEIRDVTGAITHEYSQAKASLEKKYRIETDNLKLKDQEAKSALQTHLMEQIAAVDSAMRLANEDFKRKSEGKMQQFHQLFDEHKRRQKEMKTNEQTIIKKTQEIAHWRRKIKNNSRESKEENDRLRQEKENLSLHFRELKDIMAQFRTNEARKLAELSVAFEDSISELTKRLGLAEKILKYSEMTRKLETEREQVLPFPTSITETSPEIERQMKQFKFQLKGDSKFVNESELFDKFYRRYNRVLLESLSLQREKNQLSEKNAKLKVMLNKYMSGVGIDPDLQSKPNTLFVVNQNTNAARGHYDASSIPVVDAPLTIASTRMQCSK